jgi:outer membrane protein TolC
VGGGNSVNVVDSTVNVQSSFSGSTADGTATGSILSPTLHEALGLGLRFNLGTISQGAAVMRAQGQRQVARSSLLPNLNAAISEELERLNLRTMGVESNTFPLTAPFNFFIGYATLGRESFSFRARWAAERHSSALEGSVCSGRGLKASLRG